MTEAHSNPETPHATAEADKPLFTAAEIEQFGADDGEAGGSIGKMLSALFLYTVVAMSIAGWWTWSTINARNTGAAGPAGHQEAAH
jgi:hypothetical protein